MAKSIKLKNNIYFDSSGISYNRKNLKSMLNSIGKVYSVGFSDVETKAETTSNIIASLTLPAGNYVVRGFFYAAVYDYRCIISVHNAVSVIYDPNGWVNGSITDIVECNVESTISFVLGYGTKDALVSGNLYAIKIK